MRFVLTVVLISVVSLAGEQLVSGQAPAIKAPLSDSDRQVMELVDKLESNRFSERTRATRELQQLGAAAHKSLEKVIAHGGTEASNRAYQLLVKQFKSADPVLSQSAEKYLRQIAADKKNPKSLSAEQLLNPPEQAAPGTPNAQRPRNVIPVPRAPVIRRQIQFQMRSTNGRRESSITENGRTFKFSDDGKTIKVERPDDNGGVKKAEYKDKDELKEKDSEAYEMMQRISGKGNRIKIQMGNPLGGGVPGFAPIQPRIRIQPPRARQPLQPLKPVPPNNKAPLQNPPVQPKKPKLILT